ncbi:MAG: dipeptidase [Bacteroidetes bacterium]|nr:dipeptidase [Bacteroidota bacterium]
MRRTTNFTALLSIMIVCFVSSCNNRHLSPEEIHNYVFTVDSHTDTPMWFIRSEFDFGQRHDPIKDRSCVDIPRMEEGGLDAVFLAVFTSQGERTDEAYDKVYAFANRILDSIESTADKNAERTAIVTTPVEAYALEEEGRRALFIGVENGYPIGNDLSKIGMLYDRGARYITLCHTRNNQICDSSADTTEHNGLSPFGEEVVKEMNRLGMMIDVSHISDSSFYDVIHLSTKPVIASHSCARAICDNPRNLTDDMLRSLAANGGVIQLCILSDYVKKPEPNPLRDSLRETVRTKFRGFEGLSDEEMKQARKEWYAIDSIAPRKLATVKDAVDHIDHIVAVAGIDHVGIGTDFDGGGGLADCRDVSQLPSITKELVARGYSTKDIKKIWGENLMRVMAIVSA